MTELVGFPRGGFGPFSKECHGYRLYGDWFWQVSHE